MTAQELKKLIKMDKFRYSIDLGSGYQLVDVYDNDLKLEVKKSDDSDLIPIKKLSGSISFIGQVAEDIFSKRLINYKLPFKIEEYNGSVWSVLHECLADIRKSYERLARVIKITDFEEVSISSLKILEAIDTKFNLKDISPQYLTNPITHDVESVLFTVESRPTDLSASDYKIYYDIEGGYTSPRWSDYRWKYFYLISTTGTSPNIVYTFGCYSFEVDPSISEYEKMLYFGENKWVKISTGSSTTESINVQYSKYNYELYGTIPYMLAKIDPSITISPLYIEGFDPYNTYIGDTSELKGEAVTGIEVSLAEIFNMLRYYYNVGWYVDNGYLKFKHKPVDYTDNTIDWSSETINLNTIDFADPPLPDSEIFSFLDSDRYESIYINSTVGSYVFPWAKFIVSYFDKSIPVEGVVLDRSVNFYADIFNLKKVEIESNKPIWIVYDSSTEVFTIKDCKNFYEAGTTPDGLGGERFSQYNPWFIDNETNNYILMSSTGSGTRPIYEINYNKWLNDYSALSLLSKILLFNGNTGYLNSYIIDMDTGSAEFKIRFKEIIL